MKISKNRRYICC